MDINEDRMTYEVQMTAKRMTAEDIIFIAGLNNLMICIKEITSCGWSQCLAI